MHLTGVLLSFLELHFPTGLATIAIKGYRAAKDAVVRLGAIEDGVIVAHLNSIDP
jgi:hypothetical protein